jgi:hypothetical protein
MAARSAVARHAFQEGENTGQTTTATTSLLANQSETRSVPSRSVNNFFKGCEPKTFTAYFFVRPSAAKILLCLALGAVPSRARVPRDPRTKSPRYLIRVK